jgi:hypothetical protein
MKTTLHRSPPPHPSQAEIIAFCRGLLRTIATTYRLLPSCVISPRTRLASTARLHFFLSLDLHLGLTSDLIAQAAGRGMTSTSARRYTKDAYSAYRHNPEFRRKQLDILASIHRQAITHED